MPRFTVTAYADTPSRFDFEVEAESAEDAEAKVKAIIERAENLSEHYVHDGDMGPLVIDPDMTEEAADGDASA